MTQPKPCPTCGFAKDDYSIADAILKGSALSPEDLEALKKVRDQMNEELRLLQGYAPNVDEYDATMATLYAGWAAALTALIDKWGKE